MSLPGARSIPDVSLKERSSALHSRTPSWKLGLAFFVGFGIQFNILIGGGGEGASATGGYGYRLLDFIVVGMAGLLGLYALHPRRVLALAAYTLIVGLLFAAPTLSSDSRTAILAYHYVGYAFAALFVAILVDDVPVMERFCWGLIAGLVATLPVFAIQGTDYASKLVEWGLTPGYARALVNTNIDFARYAGLTGHPNEAGHVAALSAAAGGYFAFTRRKFLPLIVVAAALLVVFYYARSRGGLIAGFAVIALPFIVKKGGAALLRFAVGLLFVLLAVVVVSQVDFIASRFSDDANQANNVADRLNSILAGVEVMLSHPFGMAVDVYISYVAADSGGVMSPHNGFLFLGGVFGLMPLLGFLVACVAALRVRNEVDLFFALFTLQVTISLLFEQLPGSYWYAFAICLIIAHEYLSTPIGGEFKGGSAKRRRRTALISRSVGRSFT